MTVDTSVAVSDTGTAPIKVVQIQDANGDTVDVQCIYVLDGNGNPSQLLTQETGLAIIAMLERINAKLAIMSNQLP